MKRYVFTDGGFVDAKSSQPPKREPSPFWKDPTGTREEFVKKWGKPGVRLIYGKDGHGGMMWRVEDRDGTMLGRGKTESESWECADALQTAIQREINRRWKLE